MQILMLLKCGINRSVSSEVGNRIQKSDYPINQTRIFKSENRIGLTPAKQSCDRNLNAENLK